MHHPRPLISLFFLTLAALPACSDDGGEGQTTGETSTGGGTSGTTGESTTGESTTGESTTSTTSTGEDPTPTTTEPTTTAAPTTGEVESDPALYAACKQALDDTQSAAVSECECDVMAGEFPDLASCLGGDPSSMGNYCPCEVYARPPESKAGLDCFAPAAAAHAKCAEMATCTQEAFDACGVALITALLQCEEAPESLQAELDAACGGGGEEEGGEPFSCESGEQVPGSFACDGEPDCEDGSDELNCR